MSDLDQALPGQQTDDEDAQLDALLAAADAAVLGRLAEAVDIDSRPGRGLRAIGHRRGGSFQR